MSTLTSFSRRSVLAMPIALAACNSKKQVLEFFGLTMGTTYNVVAIDHNNAVSKSEVETEIASALNAVNTSMSNWDTTSEISLFNAATDSATLDMSADLAEVMAASADVNIKSQGRFDTTIGSLIELWGFGAPGSQPVPNADAIAVAMGQSGHANTLNLNGTQLQKSGDATQVYLAGIGKGYGADRIGRALNAMGITDYMVEIGGDLVTSGRNPNGLPWQIGIESPNAADRAVMDVVPVSNRGLASSGDYRNYFEVDGQRYSHLIDPTTGHPVTHTTASATVLADNAMLADAWSTAMLILGTDRGLDIAEAEGIAVQFVDRDVNAQDLQFKTIASSSFRDLTA